MPAALRCGYEKAHHTESLLPPPLSHHADGMPCYTAAEEVVLVELAEGQVQHAPTTRVILEQIAPQARLTVLPA